MVKVSKEDLFANGSAYFFAERFYSNGETVDVCYEGRIGTAVVAKCVYKSEELGYLTILDIDFATLTQETDR